MKKCNSDIYPCSDESAKGVPWTAGNIVIIVARAGGDPIAIGSSGKKFPCLFGQAFKLQKLLIVKTDDENDDEDIRPFPLYVTLCCGIIIILVGIYLLIYHIPVTGITAPRRSLGSHYSITGAGVIFIGLALSIFPAYQLIRRKRSLRG